MSRGHLRRVHPDEQSRPARLLERSGETVAESALPLRSDLEAFRRPSVVRASEKRSRRLRPGTAATASRVSRSAARASRAACSGLHGGQRRVLEKPGAGALAMTITAGGSSQGGPCHRRCGLVPSPIPVTFERGASCASRACARTGNPSRLSLGLYPHLRESAPHPSLDRSWWETQLIGDLRVG